ncbi:UTP--glucose-1-phosphate uridylyltransferase [Paracoccus spongiarum]|uniref:UTP--glucose-1-phosphate uridylyltransferase n=1 Tax=Paracoccus spongiarum TaxID=3064387 RepID=A0ABT9JHA1_9RHOB|nr:UTP--glucose-1-phosphate uridylyltransferase [Paracoccus sp. 2205BS29-5]MDP5309219.1 UTP--glucose-1-phosphate uridylyltransferase [Paracoccus sp. 2205BS29-5]
MSGDLDLKKYSGLANEEKMALRLIVASQVIDFSNGNAIAPGAEEVLGSPSPALHIERSNRVTKAVIPVAGLGTRLLPATKTIPKEIMPLVDRPLIQYAIDEARAAGIKEFIFVTSRGKGALEDYFDQAHELEASLKKAGKTELLEIVRSTNMESGAIAIIRQQKALGLGHAIWCARRLITDDPFAVLLPDDVIIGDPPCLQQMIEAYQETGGCMVATMAVPADEISSYGVLDVAEDIGAIVRVRGLVEKPRDNAPSNLAVIGRYILAPTVMNNLNKLKQGSGGEVHLTGAIADEIAEGRNVYGLRFRGQRFDCGSKAGFIRASIALALEREELRYALEDFLQDRVALRSGA